MCLDCIPCPLNATTCARCSITALFDELRVLDSSKPSLPFKSRANEHVAWSSPKPTHSYAQAGEGTSSPSVRGTGMRRDFAGSSLTRQYPANAQTLSRNR